MKTLEDFMRLPEGTLAELIGGELLMSPSPKKRHQRMASRLSRLLGNFIDDRRLGDLYIAPFDVHLPSGDVVEPDLVFVARHHLDIVQDWIRGVPDLVVEILSPDSIDRDRVVKRRLYERNGVPEYWIVDPELPSVDVLRLRSAVYVPHGTFGPRDVLDSPTLPGLSLPLASLLS